MSHRGPETGQGQGEGTVGIFCDSTGTVQTSNQVAHLLCAWYKTVQRLLVVWVVSWASCKARHYIYVYLGPIST